jgi:hypothetical protein
MLNVSRDQEKLKIVYDHYRQLNMKYNSETPQWRPFRNTPPVCTRNTIIGGAGAPLIIRLSVIFRISQALTGSPPISLLFILVRKYENEKNIII